MAKQPVTQKAGGVSGPRPDTFRPDGSGLVWVVTYVSPISGDIEADPSVYTEFKEALAVASEIALDDVSSDPTIIMVVIDPLFYAPAAPRPEERP